MENKKIIKIFSITILIITIITLILSIFYSKAFIPTTMLMASLYLFSICYSQKNNNQKVTYSLYVIGILLIIGSLIYTTVRIVNG